MKTQDGRFIYTSKEFAKDGISEKVSHSQSSQM